uniref:Endoribonuclease dcr-1-like n=1 Tax=Dermatophagoides pteronyssinus TaxID=6956 RepID=A0A6P6XWX1_DERPT|nr:endoribonuclease dcr-1-like [Dermatophagoides pteronyssinus]
MANLITDGHQDDDMIRMGQHKLRDYQKHLFLEAKKGNIIICLPTGSGKTLIALCLIRHMFEQTIGPYPSIAKRTFFLAPNRALISQQYETAITLLPGKITIVTGDQNPDDFSENDWIKKLENYQLFFVTPAILYDILVKGYITLNNINLIVFDEMHWATKKRGRDSGHFYAQIMKFYEENNNNPKDKPKILGMSATIVSHKPKEIEAFSCSVKKIEQLYHSRVMTKNFEHHINHCEEIVIQYKNINYFQIEIDFDFEKIYKCFKCDDYKDDNSNNNNDCNSMIQKKDYLKQFRLAFQKIEEVLYQTFGPWFAIELIKLYIRSLETMSFEFREIMQELLQQIRILILETIKKELAIKNPNDIKLLTNEELVSDRIRILLFLLDQFRTKTELTGIIFVKERIDANLLYLWLLQLSQSNEYYSFIKPGFICGCSSKDFIKFDQPYHYSLYGSMIKSKNINLIVATAAIEEGIDIPVCNVVIRYDEPQTYRSYSQSRGRARDKNSVYFIFTPNEMRTKMKENFAEFYKIDKATQKLANNLQESSDEEQDIEKESQEIPDTIINSMGYFKNGPSTLYPLNSLKLVNEYLTKLPRDLFSEYFLPMYQFIKDDDDQINQRKYAFVFVFPANSPLYGQLIPGGYFFEQRTAKIHCAYRTCIYLIQQNEIGDRLNIIDQKFLIKKHNEDLNIRISKQQLQTADYRKKFSNFFTQLLSPSIKTDFYYLYALEFDLMTEKYTEQQNEQYFKPKFIGSNGSSIGLLIKNPKKPFEEIFSYFFFNLFPIKFRLIPCGRFFNEDKIELIEHFHHYHAFDLILEKFRSGRFENSSLNKSIMIVLVKRKPYSKQYMIDYDQMEKCRQWMIMMKNFNQNLESISPDHQQQISVYDPSKIDDEFDLYGYFCQKKIELMFRKSDEIRLPTDIMSSDESQKTYREYFSNKFKRNLCHPDQPMIHSKIFRRFYESFGLIRSIKTTNEKKKTFHNFLPRELLYIYPLSSIICLRIMAIPLILYRLEQFSLCNEFLQSLQQYGIDVDHCVDHVDYYEQKQFELNVKKLPFEQLATIDPDSMDEKSQSKIYRQNTINDKLKEILPKKDISIEKSSTSLSEDSMEKLFEKLFRTIKSFLHEKNRQKSSDDYGQFIAQLNPDQEAIDYGYVSIFKFVGNIRETIDNEAIFFDTFDIIQCPNPWQILYGLTLAKAQDLWNIERYETIGDAFIKMTTSLYLYWKYPKYDESRLTTLKTALISNQNLAQIALEKKIHQLIFGSLNETIYELFFKRFSFMHTTDDDNYLSVLKMKDLADCIEALIGVFLIHGSASTALAFLEYLDLKAFDPTKAKIDLEKHLQPKKPIIITDIYQYKESIEEIPLFEIEEKLFNLNPIKHDSDLFERFYCESMLDEVEKIIDYKFNNKYYLLVAFTHATYGRSDLLNSIMIPSYQQMEFCGDAILDHLITMYLFVCDERLSPHEITDIRSALVNNMFYAHIMAKYQLYKYIRHSSIAMTDMIAKFIKKFRYNSIGTLFELISNGQEEFNSENVDEIDVPKVLSDVFEALIAAVYFDCDFKLDIVWQVVYRMIIYEIRHFLKNRPKMPINRLYVEYPMHSFSDVTQVAQSIKLQSTNQLEMVVNLTVEPYGTFEGRGYNRRQCRTSAAKKFFTHLRKIDAK